MITNTFSMLSGIGPATERKLWREGVLTWEDFIRRGSIGFISPARKGMYDRSINEAGQRLGVRDAAYFAEVLKSTEHWRLFDEFAEEAVCLDIETNGLSHAEGGVPTVVGLYGADGFTAFVKGDKLSAEAVMEKLSGYKYLISFFGSVFDVPFLKATLEGFEVNMPHFDLCFASRSLGYKGGLKKLEPEMGIVRQQDTAGLDGYDAVLLWQRARKGDDRAMRLLIDYNREDTVNLMQIAHRLYPMMREATGIGEFV